MRKLSFSTNAFKKWELEDAITTIAEVGYDGVEILGDVPHAYPSHFGFERRMKLRSKLESLGLRVSNLNAFTLFALGNTYHPSWIDERREERIEFTLEAIELCEGIGSPCLSTEPGGPHSADRTQAFGLFVDGLRKVLPRAEELGVKILVEPEPALLIETTYQMLELLWRVESEALGVNFDLGHFWCVGENPSEAFSRLKPWVHHIHIEDIAERRHFHLLPGKGEIDFAEFFATVDELGYDGFFTVELYTYEETAEEVCRRALDFLRLY